ncbi:MAG: hypothetical protein WAN89_07860 [Lawsonella sp.]
MTDPQSTELPMNGEASQATEPAALLRIGCVYGVLPDKWQRRWSENRPDVTTEWHFIDAAEQWEKLAQQELDIVLARTVTDPVRRSSIDLLSYAPAALWIPADVHNQINLVELYEEKLAVIARKKHDCTLVDVVSEADWESFSDPRIGAGQLIIPEGQPELALTYAESGAGVGVLPETLVKALGAEYTGVAQPLAVPPATRICAVWFKERTAQCPEAVIQDFVGALRGRRARSSRTENDTQDVEQRRKAKRQQKIAASRRKTRAFNQQQKAARKRPRHRRRRS